MGQYDETKIGANCRRTCEGPYHWMEDKHYKLWRTIKVCGTHNKCTFDAVCEAGMRISHQMSSMCFRIKNSTVLPKGKSATCILM